MFGRPLVKLEDGSGTVAQYEYDGAKRRTVKKTYTSGTLSETRHFYYTEPSRWQVVEERVESSSDAERQFVWGLRYVDDIVLRDRDTDDDGTLDERLYGLQDANWNVTSVANPSGAIHERFAYRAYGASETMTAAFVFRGNSSYAWETRYAGYFFDSESTWLYVRNRFLSPTVSWLSRDPLGLASAVSLYEYCDSNPTADLDPLGLIPISCNFAQIHKKMCRFLNWPALHDKLNDAVTCACLIAGWLDTLPIPAVGNNPLIEQMDCACNILTATQLFCDNKFVSAGLYFSASMLDCVSTPLGKFIGPMVSCILQPYSCEVAALPSMVVADFVIDHVTMAIQSMLTNDGLPFPISQSQACVRLLG